MNKLIAFVVGAVTLLLIVLAFVFWPGGGGLLPGSEEEWVPGGSSFTDTVTVTEPGGNGTPTTDTSAEAQEVQQTYQAVVVENGNQDNVKLGRTSVTGEWALQVWVGDMTGGQALLRYDTPSNAWVLVSSGGGAWDVEGLVQFGVPEDVATSLVAGLRR